MIKRSFLLLGLGIALLVIVAGFLFFEQKNSSAPQNYLVPTPTKISENQAPSSQSYGSISSLPSPTVALQQDPTAPQDIVNIFYTWYISSPQNLVSSGAYIHNKYLSPAFKDQITALAANSKNYDPILCTQNKSDNFVVGQPVYNDLGNQAKVIVSANVVGGKDLYRFVLNYMNGKWLIGDIICIP